MSSKLPEKPDGPSGEEPDGTSKIVQIENLHLHASDIDALRRLSDSDPELARIVVDQKDKFDARYHGSYRFGLAASVVLVLSSIGALTLALIYLGVLKGMLLLAGVIAAAVFVRVILTGEWSETSMIGQIIGAMVKMLGGTPKE